MRNLFACALSSLLFSAIPLLAAGGDGSEALFVPLFDGRSLKDWVQVYKNGPGYAVQDGRLICPACPHNSTLFTAKEYSNFVFRFEFRTEPQGENGIAIRSEIGGDPAYQAMVIPILADEHPAYADIPPSWHHGSVFDVIPARTGFLREKAAKVAVAADPEWNEEEITANGRRITVRLNGTVILDADLDSVKDPEVLKKHPGLARTKGRIGLIGHRRWTEFRNLRIRELP